MYLTSQEQERLLKQHIFLRKNNKKREAQRLDTCLRKKKKKQRHREQEEGSKKTKKTGYLLNITHAPHFLQDITDIILGTWGSVCKLDPQFPIPSNINSTPLKILATKKLREYEHNLQESPVSTPGTPAINVH